jgi:hypothetical protein
LVLLGLAVGASTNDGAAQAAKPVEEAVIVHFQYGSKDLSRLFELEDRLEKAVAHARTGEYDGNEVNVDGSDGFLYLYGPSADRLFDTVRPILESTPFMRGATVTKRYGAALPGTKKSSLVIQP